MDNYELNIDGFKELLKKIEDNSISYVENLKSISNLSQGLYNLIAGEYRDKLADLIGKIDLHTNVINENNVELDTLIKKIVASSEEQEEEQSEELKKEEDDKIADNKEVLAAVGLSGLSGLFDAPIQNSSSQQNPASQTPDNRQSPERPSGERNREPQAYQGGGGGTPSGGGSGSGSSEAKPKEEKPNQEKENEADKKSQNQMPKSSSCGSGNCNNNSQDEFRRQLEEEKRRRNEELDRQIEKLRANNNEKNQQRTGLNQAEDTAKVDTTPVSRPSGGGFGGGGQSSSAPENKQPQQVQSPYYTPNNYADNFGGRDNERTNNEEKTETSDNLEDKTQKLSTENNQEETKDETYKDIQSLSNDETKETTPLELNTNQVIPSETVEQKPPEIKEKDNTGLKVAGAIGVAGLTTAGVGLALHNKNKEKTDSSETITYTSEEKSTDNLDDSGFNTY